MPPHDLTFSLPLSLKPHSPMTSRLRSFHIGPTGNSYHLAPVAPPPVDPDSVTTKRVIAILLVCFLTASFHMAMQLRAVRNGQRPADQGLFGSITAFIVTGYVLAYRIMLSRVHARRLAEQKSLTGEVFEK